MSDAGGTSRDAEEPGHSSAGSRRRRRVAFSALALAGIAAGVAWALLGSRLLAVRSVVVTGTRLVPQSQVLAVAGIRLGTPLMPLYLVTAAVSSLRGDPDVGAAAAVLGELPAPLRASVASVAAPSPDQVTLQLASGVTVLWGGTDHAQAKAEELGLLMPTHASYYDVSAPGSAVTN